LYDHLNKRINEKPEDEPSILGEVVKLMEAPQTTNSSNSRKIF